MAPDPNELSLAQQAEIAIARALAFLVVVELPVARGLAMALVVVGARALRALGGTRELAHSCVDEGFRSDQEFQAHYAQRPN